MYREITLSNRLAAQGGGDETGNKEESPISPPPKARRQNREQGGVSNFSPPKERYSEKNLKKILVNYSELIDR